MYLAISADIGDVLPDNLYVIDPIFYCAGAAEGQDEEFVGCVCGEEATDVVFAVLSLSAFLCFFYMCVYEYGKRKDVRFEFMERGCFGFLHDVAVSGFAC